MTGVLALTSWVVMILLIGAEIVRGIFMFRH